MGVLFRFCCKFSFAVFQGLLLFVMATLSRGAIDMEIGILLFAVAHNKPANFAAGVGSVLSAPAEDWS